MAFLKILRTIRQQGPGTALRRIADVAPAYIRGLKQWRVRRCQCCQHETLFIAQDNGIAESRSCLFCSANERYELLAQEIRSRYGKRLEILDVLEFDPHSPLRRILALSRTYTRTFFEKGCLHKQKHGAICADITALSFPDDSFDLLVSSEVLEHVPELDEAFREVARVLRPGGAHLFTVPPRARTRKRAEIVNGEVKHLEEPDYHIDPLNPQGILAFWDIGPDLPNVISCAGMKVTIVRGPAGDDGRVVWMAEKTL